MEYKVSGTNWLCIRATSDSTWVAAVELTPQQASELAEVIKAVKGKKGRIRGLDSRDSMVNSVDIISDR